MCTPFCDDNSCPYRDQHNNFIISLVKLQESGKEADIDEWKKLIITTKEMCDLNQPLEDPDPDLRYPLLHWAATLGKIKAVQWLLKQDFIYLRKPPQGKTNSKVVFSMVRFLHVGLPTTDPRKILKIFLKILDLLLTSDPDLLLVEEGPYDDTVLHLCARGEEGSNAPFLKYLKGILVKLHEMSRKNKTQQLENVLVKKNKEGDTFMRTVAKFRNAEEVKVLMDLVNERFERNISSPVTTVESSSSSSSSVLSTDDHEENYGDNDENDDDDHDEVFDDDDKRKASEDDAPLSTLFKAKESVQRLALEKKRKWSQETLKLKKAKLSLQECENKIRSLLREKERKKADVKKLEETVEDAERKFTLCQQFLENVY